MELSIIIPIFNTTINELKNCIDNLENIDNKIKSEIILINDGSKLEKNIEYQNYVKQHKNIIYREIKHAGVSNARNIGVNYANGKYITFVDSDDILYTDKIKKEFLKLEYDMIIFNMKVKNKNGESIIKFDNENKEIMYKELLEKCINCNKLSRPVAIFYNTKFLKENNISFDREFIQGEDLLFNLNVINNKPKVYYINETIYCYYQDFNHGKQRTINNSNVISKNIYELYCKRKKMIEENYNGKEKIRTINELNNEYINSIYIRNKIMRENDKKNNDYLKYLDKININIYNIYKLNKKNIIKWILLKNEYAKNTIQGRKKYNDRQ